VVLEMFAIVIRLAHSSSSSILQRQALLILRNLAFSSTHKARIVAERKCFLKSIINSLTIGNLTLNTSAQ
jgi:hypothetical protein